MISYVYSPIFFPQWYISHDKLSKLSLPDFKPQKLPKGHQHEKIHEWMKGIQLRSSSVLTLSGQQLASFLGGRQLWYNRSSFPKFYFWHDNFKCTLHMGVWNIFWPEGQKSKLIQYKVKLNSWCYEPLLSKNGAIFLL